LTADEKVTITVDDILSVSPRSREGACQILSRLHKKGWLRRLRRGVYSVVPLSSMSATPAVEDPWALAMALFGPAFISGWSAAEHWDLTDQIFNTVSIVTAKPQRRADQVIGGVRFRTRSLPAKRFFGSLRIWSNSNPIMMADPSRTLIDILDSPRFGAGGRHVLDVAKAYWRSEHQDPDTLLQYAIRFGRGSVFKRLGFIAEHVNANVTDDWIETCHRHLTAGITRLDPDVPSTGPIATRWMLRINVPLESS
jgi:predicted transcriptional regulator of viral defense system